MMEADWEFGRRFRIEATAPAHTRCLIPTRHQDNTFAVDPGKVVLRHGEVVAAKHAGRSISSAAIAPNSDRRRGGLMISKARLEKLGPGPPRV